MIQIAFFLHFLLNKFYVNDDENDQKNDERILHFTFVILPVTFFALLKGIVGAVVIFDHGSNSVLFFLYPTIQAG